MFYYERQKYKSKWIGNKIDEIMRGLKYLTNEKSPPPQRKTTAKVVKKRSSEWNSYKQKKSRR